MFLSQQGIIKRKELEENYRKLEKRLAGKRGEFVLLSYRAKIPFKYTMRHTVYRYASCYRLGVLEGEELVWKKAEDSLSTPPITLPIPRYLKGEIMFIRPGDNVGKVVKKNIFAHSHCYENPPSLQALMQKEQGSIVIGDEEVKEWFKKHSMEELFKPAAAALSKLILEPTDDTV